MNIWLNKFFDFRIIDIFQEHISSNVLVHCEILAKYRGLSSHNVIGPLHFLSEIEMLEYGKFKIQWERQSRLLISSLFSKSCTNDGLSGNHSSTLERLFFNSTLAFLDAFVSVKTISPTLLKGQRIRVIVGGPYRMQELITLIWWIAALNSEFNVDILEYYYAESGSGVERIENLESLLNKLSLRQSYHPEISGEIAKEIQRDRIPISIAWVGALRYPHGWDNEMISRGASDSIVLRISEQGRSIYHHQPCIEFDFGHGLSSIEIKNILHSAISLINKEKINSIHITRNLNWISTGIETFYREIVAPLISKKLLNAVNSLNDFFEKVEVQAAFSVTAPFLESVALHEWLQKRKILPTLFPHSWTSSHEFSTSSYLSSLAFIRSSDILSSSNLDSAISVKEVIVSEAAIRHRNMLNGKTKKSIYFNLGVNIKKFRTYSCRLLIAYLHDYIKTYICSLLFKRISKGGCVTVGLLLNYEHCEFNVGINFISLFTAINRIKNLLGELLGDKKVKLVIRRKVGWTNPHLLKNYLQSEHYPNASSILCPERIGLKEFSDACQLVLFMQGTSAVPEIMSFGIPVIRLVGAETPLLLEDQYIQLPISIVPSMTIFDVAKKITEDPKWLAELALLQKLWVKSKMTFT